MTKYKYLDWFHYVLLAFIAFLLWDSHQKDLTIQSAQKLISVQRSSLETGQRALEMTTEYKQFKAAQEATATRTLNDNWLVSH